MFCVNIKRYCPCTQPILHTCVLIKLVMPQNRSEFVGWGVISASKHSVDSLEENFKGLSGHIKVCKSCKWSPYSGGSAPSVRKSCMSSCSTAYGELPLCQSPRCLTMAQHRQSFPFAKTLSAGRAPCLQILPKSWFCGPHLACRL